MSFEGGRAVGSRRRGRSGGLAEALTELRCGFAMAGDAEGAEIVEIALAASFCDWKNVVSVPQRTAAGNGFHAIEGQSGRARFAAGALERGEDGDGIGLAGGADAAVAGEDLIAKIAGIGTQAPLMHAEVGAEGTPAFSEDLQFAPAAERATVLAAGQQVGADAAAWQSTREHVEFRIGLPKPPGNGSAGTMKHW